MFVPMSNGDLLPGDLIINIDAPGTQIEMVLSIVEVASHSLHVTITYIFVASEDDCCGYGLYQKRVMSLDRLKKEPVPPCCQVYRNGVLIQDVDHEYW